MGEMAEEGRAKMAAGGALGGRPGPAASPVPPPAPPQLAKDLLHPSPEEEKRKHKKKRLVQSPNSYFMDVKCPGKAGERARAVQAPGKRARGPVSAVGTAGVPEPPPSLAGLVPGRCQGACGLLLVPAGSRPWPS